MTAPSYTLLIRFNPFCYTPATFEALLNYYNREIKKECLCNFLEAVKIYHVQGSAEMSYLCIRSKSDTDSHDVLIKWVKQKYEYIYAHNGHPNEKMRCDIIQIFL